MSREEIIRLAEEAGLRHEEAAEEIYSLHRAGIVLDDLERFVALVASAEREACAVVAEKLGVHPALNVYNGGPDWYKHGKQIAAKIRARGQE